MKRISISIFLTIILGFILICNFTFGQEKQADTSYTLEAPLMQKEAKDLGDYLTQVYKFLVYACIIAALFAVTIGGYYYLTAAGDANKVAKGKDIIVNAIMGLALALFAWVLLNTISPQFVTPSKIGERFKLGGAPTIPSGKEEPAPAIPSGTRIGRETRITPEQLYRDLGPYAKNNLANPQSNVLPSALIEPEENEEVTFSLKGKDGTIYTFDIKGSPFHQSHYIYDIYTYANKDGKMYELPKERIVTKTPSPKESPSKLFTYQFQPTPTSSPVTAEFILTRGVGGAATQLTGRLLD